MNINFDLIKLVLTLKTYSRDLQKGENMQSYEDVHQNVWNFLLKKLQEEVNRPGMNPNKISKIIGVNNSTVYRWLNVKRGIKRPSLEKAINILTALNVPMEEVLSEVLPEDVATILAMRQEDPELFKKILQIYRHGGKVKNKFSNEVDFLYTDSDKKIEE